MGTTKTAINKKIYRRYAKKGLQHHQIIEKIPYKYREQFIEDINKTSLETIFGVNNFWFMLVTLVLIIAFFGFLIAFSGILIF